MLKIPYKIRGRTIFSGVMWMVVAVIQLLLFSSGLSSAYPYFPALNLFVFISGLFLSLAHFFIYKFDYLRLNSEIISTDRGFPSPRKEIEISTIKEADFLEDKIVLQTQKNKEIVLKAEHISERDFQKVTTELKKLLNKQETHCKASTTATRS
ncbi:hypothetical protein FLK61_40145 [Paenalkalicoccus suaedae]|uniref:DUF5673 domain-containing protein n=1 Tax=Paenalkalicoccus suaedae TaxID=2592382 RepID=A0A859FIZ1_9BACI|nr:hypothetical protein [Paenalkalicoccus suaedae]QKS72824.1 hypothetical protein FLK61_40145 [Paenalkalicoccus suaedae]